MPELEEKKGPYTANRLLSLISVLFNLGKSWGLLDCENPVAGVVRFKEQSRARFLQPEELPRFFQSVTDEVNIDIRDYILISLFTGGRKGNVLAMRWEDIDLEKEQWTIPAEASKSAEEITLPLSVEAIAILKARESARTTPWVFPGRGRSGHIKWPRKGWARILERAGISDLRLHDLRRTLGSWQAAAGANLSVIGKSLGHRSLSTTNIYARLSLNPVRESINTAVSNMLAAADLTPAGHIDGLRTKKSEKPKRAHR